MPHASLNILVADDDPSTRLLLIGWLEGWGYRTVPASDGNEAWSILQSTPCPQIAVMDWMMPGIRGIDICRRLTNERQDRFIYSILITQRGEETAKAEGLDAGAHDFLPKPVDPEMLRQRVDVAARILDYERRIGEQNEQLSRYASELEALARERAAQLIHADRLASLGMLAAGVAHEINNPTAIVSGNAQVLGRFWSTISPLLENARPSDAQVASRLKFVLEEMPRAIDGIQEGVGRIHRIVRGLGTYARSGSGEAKETCAVADIVERSMVIARLAIHRARAEIFLEIGDRTFMIEAHAQQIEQVLVNLLVNAAHAVESCEHKKIHLRAREEGDEAILEVEDTGPGVPDELLERIWDPFFTTKPAGKGTGLGLAISQSIARAHDGRIEATRAPGGGAIFRLRLPTAIEKDRDRSDAKGGDAV